MKKQEIVENLELAQTLLGQWLRYRQFFLKGISDEEIDQQEEADFIETTSAIAQNIRKLGQRIDEKKFPFRRDQISAQLKGAISISHFRNLPEADQKGFYKELHISVIYLSRTVGALKFLNEGYVPPSLAKGKKGKKGKKGGKIVPIIFLIALAGGIVGILYFLNMI